MGVFLGRWKQIRVESHMESYSNLFLTLQRDLSAICVARALDAREKGE